MALDRTWFNSLTDDDGSNTVGTVWNKAGIDALMDTVDAEVDKAWIGYTPSLFATTGTWTAATITVRYRRTGPVLTMLYAFEGCTFSQATAGAAFNLPFPPAAAGVQFTMAPCLIYLAAYEVGGVYAQSGIPTLNIARNGGQSLPAQGGVAIRGQLIYEV